MTRGQKVAIAVVLGVGGTCLLGGYGAMYRLFGMYASQRDAELALARKEGIPLEPADLTRAIPKRDNAAPFYRLAIAELERLRSDPANKILAAAERPTSTDAEFRAAVKALRVYDKALAYVTQAAERPRCDFGRDYGLGPNLELPEYAHQKRLAKLLALRAEGASERGDWRAALADLRRVQAVARHTGDEPILIGMLVQIACEAIGHASLRRMLPRHGDNPEFLAAARAHVRDLGPLPEMQHALGGEVVMGRIAIPMIEGRNAFDFSSHGGPQKPFWPERAFFQSRPVQGAFETKLIQAWRTIYRDLPADRQDWQGAAQAMAKADVAVQADRSFANLANQVLFPVFSEAPKAIGRLQAERRLSEAALRVLEIRRAGGKLPTALPKDLGPAGIDPFDKKPLRYRWNGDRFTIYSVGSDGKDDNGRLQREASGGNHDIALRFPDGRR